MELISDFEVANPDHVKIRTRGGKLVLTITKDNTELSIGIPYNTDAIDATPVPSPRTVFGTECLTPSPKVVKLQQNSLVPEFRTMAPASRTRDWTDEQRSEARKVFEQKITDQIAREIKTMLHDKDFMSKYPSRNAAHMDIAKAYGISATLVYRIDKNMSWRHVSPAV